MAMTKEQAEKYAATVPMINGVPDVSADAATYMDYCAATGTLANFLTWQAAVIKAATQAAGSIGGPITLRIGRSGESLGFYRGKKHARSFGPDVFRLFSQNAELLAKFASSDQTMYWQAMPAYKYRGKDQPSRDAVVVQVKANTWQPSVLATGTKADELAKSLGLSPVNEITETESE